MTPTGTETSLRSVCTQTTSHPLVCLYADDRGGGGGGGKLRWKWDRTVIDRSYLTTYPPTRRTRETSTWHLLGRFCLARANTKSSVNSLNCIDWSVTAHTLHWLVCDCTHTAVTGLWLHTHCIDWSAGPAPPWLAPCLSTQVIFFLGVLGTGSTSTLHLLVAAVTLTPRPTPLKKWLNSLSKMQMFKAFVIANGGWKANCHFLQNVSKRNTVSRAHLSPHTYTAGVEWCGIGHQELCTSFTSHLHSWCGMVWYRTSRAVQIFHLTPTQLVWNGVV